MRLTPDAKGVFPIAPTPFHPDGRIDEASVDRMTDFYGEIGATGVDAAVADAVHDAVGVRLRELPLTPARVLTALQPPV